MISCISICAASYGQENGRRAADVSIDILSLAKERTVTLDFSHAFHMNWSAGGGVSVHIPDRKGVMTERMEHEDNLLLVEKPDATDIVRPEPEFSIGLRFWPEGYHKGAHISLCGAFRAKGYPDMILGAGYAIEIWNGIGADIGYRKTIISTMLEDDEAEKGIYVSLSYRF